MAWAVNKQHFCSEIAMSDSPAGEKGLNRTQTRSIGIHDPDLRGSLGVQLGAGPGKYKSPQIKKFIINKTREHLEMAQRPRPESFVLGHNIDDFCSLQ